MQPRKLPAPPDIRGSERADAWWCNLEAAFSVADILPALPVASLLIACVLAPK